MTCYTARFGVKFKINDSICYHRRYTSSQGDKWSIKKERMKTSGHLVPFGSLLTSQTNMPFHFQLAIILR